MTIVCCVVIQFVGLNNSQVARPTESAYRSSKQQSSNDGQPVVTNTLGEKSMLEAVMGKPVTTADVQDAC